MRSADITEKFGTQERLWKLIAVSETVSELLSENRYVENIIAKITVKDDVAAMIIHRERRNGSRQE